MLFFQCCLKNSAATKIQNDVLIFFVCMNAGVRMRSVSQQAQRCKGDMKLDNSTQWYITAGQTAPVCLAPLYRKMASFSSLFLSYHMLCTASGVPSFNDLYDNEG